MLNFQVSFFFFLLTNKIRIGSLLWERGCFWFSKSWHISVKCFQENKSENKDIGDEYEK